MAKINRREFVLANAIGLTVTPRRSFGRAPTVLRQSVKPIVISSANGHRFRNGGTQTCVELAFRRITDGDDLLDALIAGVTIVELDPEDTSVGYGGRPNAAGVVQLDACCMEGSTRRAGGVAALEGVRTPSQVAQAVMLHTDHHLLVGSGAQNFARQLGFNIEADLNTDRSRRLWLEWKRRTDTKIQTALSPNPRSIPHCWPKHFPTLMRPMALSTAMASTYKDSSQASQRQVAWLGRSPAALVTRQSLEQDFMWTVK